MGRGVPQPPQGGARRPAEPGRAAARWGSTASRPPVAHLSPPSTAPVFGKAFVLKTDRVQTVLPCAPCRAPKAKHLVCHWPSASHKPPPTGKLPVVLLTASLVERAASPFNPPLRLVKGRGFAQSFPLSFLYRERLCGALCLVRSICSPLVRDRARTAELLAHTPKAGHC